MGMDTPSRRGWVMGGPSLPTYSLGYPMGTGVIPGAGLWCIVSTLFIDAGVNAAAVILARRFERACFLTFLESIKSGILD